MTWLRWDIQTPRHRVIGRLATELNVRRAEAVGLYFSCCLGFGENQTDGRPGSVTDHDLESWAFWTGKRGRFATAFRTLCVTDGSQEDDERDVPGVIRGWWRQGAIIRKQVKDASRPPSHLRNHPQESRDIPPGESRLDCGGDGGRGTGDGNEDELLPTTPGLPGRLVSRLVGHPSRFSITGLLDALPESQNVNAWAGCLLGCLDGQGLKQGRAATVEELAAACTDYLATAQHNWGLIHFRSFVDRIIGKRFHTRAGGPTGDSKTKRAIEETVAWAERGDS